MNFVRILTLLAVATVPNAAIGAEANFIPDSVNDIKIGDSYNDVLAKTKDIFFIVDTVPNCLDAVPADDCVVVSAPVFSKPLLTINNVPYWLSVYFDKGKQAKTIKLSHHNYQKPSLDFCISAYEAALDAITQQGTAMQHLPFKKKQKSLTNETPAKNPYAIAKFGDNRTELKFEFSPQKSSPFKAPRGPNNNAFKPDQNGRHVFLTGEYIAFMTSDTEAKTTCSITLALTD